jgi:hypothetical protein
MLKAVRILLILVTVGLFLDAALHPYTWPGEPFQPTRRVRAIRVLGTHSREAADTWAIILCMTLIYFVWRREQDEIEEKKTNDSIDQLGESTGGDEPPEPTDRPN